MYLIQFLEPPTIETEDETLCSFVNATVSVISTPRNLLVDEDVSLVASLISDHDDGTPCLDQCYQWGSGNSSLHITLDITNINVIWPARMQVRAKDQDVASLADTIILGVHNKAKGPYIQNVCSDLIDPSEEEQRVPKAERQFVLSSERVLTIWEGLDDKIAGQQLKPAGVVLLAYLDSVIASKADADANIPELNNKLARAAWKTLNVVSIGDNCGIVGIGIAQLIPDCQVMMVDVPHQGSLTKTNIKEMFPAVLSSVKQKSSKSEEFASFGRTAKSTLDLIFVTDYPDDAEGVRQTAELLTDLVARSPKVVIVVAREAKRRKERHFIWEVMEETLSSHCGRVSVPAADTAKFSETGQDLHFEIDVFRAKIPERRRVSRQNSATRTELSILTE